jgi:hypothetical protein
MRIEKLCVCLLFSSAIFAQDNPVKQSKSGQESVRSFPTPCPQLPHMLFGLQIRVARERFPPFPKGHSRHRNCHGQKKDPRKFPWVFGVRLRQKIFLLQGVHQTGDRAVQFLVRAAQFFNLVDGVQHRGVVLAAKLPADFRQRCGGQLLYDVHGHLARESDSSGSRRPARG